jgi:CheY-like chemotaxis protein
MVEKCPGFRAAYASNGAEALALLRKGEPVGIVLTDLQMPEMNGLELVQAIREGHPLVPVILMTAHGSEAIAIQALQVGAASYVPKQTLAEDLGPTLDQVLNVARTDRRQQRMLDCLTQLEANFELDNDPGLVPALVTHLQDYLTRLKVCDQNGRIRVGVALEEALLNGIYHGNLELSSDLRQDGGDAYERQARERRQRPPYRERRLHVRLKVSRAEAVYTVRDEGPGFDPSRLPDPTDPANLGKTSGRGLLLIRTFMDQVSFNASGNEITLVKRAAAPRSA